MCLWFTCFGIHKHDDDCYTPPPGAATKPHYHNRPTMPAPAPQQNGYGYHNGHYGNGYGAHHQTTAAAADEAGRKASNDARTKGHAAVARDDAPLAYAATVTQQPAAWNGRVAEAAGHGHGAQPQYYNYYERQPVHYYSTATATADRERY